MKKSILSFICILGLGVGSVLGQQMVTEGQSIKRDSANERQPQFGPKMRMNGLQMALLNELGNYFDAYQYFNVIARSAKPTNKKAIQAVEKAEKIMQNQKDFIDRISNVARQFKNIPAFSQLSDRISAQLNERKSELEDLAHEDLDLANAGKKRFIWEHIRKYKKDMHRFRHGVNAFIKELNQRMNAMGQTASFSAITEDFDGNEMIIEEVDVDEDEDEDEDDNDQ